MIPSTPITGHEKEDVPNLVEIVKPARVACNPDYLERKLPK